MSRAIRGMKPQVSVIIPSFNRPLMLVEAVRSVLSQRDVRFELIVVDDGSTDTTPQAAAAALAGWLEGRGAYARAGNNAGFCGARIERISHCGVGAARNYGAALGQAEFLAFLDSDDLWAPAKLGRQVDFMRSHKRYLLSQTQELWMSNGRRVNPGLRHRKRAGDIFADSLRTCLISPSATMITRDLFFAFGGFDRRLGACEDYDLWLRILSRHEVGLLDQPLVIRRAGHPNQLSVTTPAPDRFRIVTLLKLLADTRLEPARRKAAARVLAGKCRVVAGGLKRRNRFLQARLYAQAGAIAETHWCFGDLDELASFTRALTRYALAENNFTDGSGRASAAASIEEADGLELSRHGGPGVTGVRQDFCASAGDWRPAQVREQRLPAAAAPG